MSDNIPVSKAQVPQACHMCEEFVDIKFKCLNCDFLLCERCRIWHGKVKTQDVHKIINLKDKEVIGVKSTMVHVNHCNVHEDQNYIMYCVDCKQPVCATCLVTTHQKHILGDIKNIYEDTKKNLNQYKDKIDVTILPDLTRKYQKLDGLLKLHTEKADKAKMRINECGQYLKDQVAKVVEKQTKDFFQEIDKHIKEISDRISPQISVLGNMKDEIKEIRQQIDDIAECNDINRFITLDTAAKLAFEKLKFNTKQERTNFIEFESFPFKTVQKLGELKIRNIIDFQQIASMRTELPCVDKIISVKDGYLFVRNWESRTIIYLKIENAKAVELNKWQLDIKDMAALPNWDILLIFADKTEVKILPCASYTKTDNNRGQSNDLKIFFDASPQVPTAVHVSVDNKVIISTVEAGRDWLPMEDPCYVQIFVLSTNGDVISRFDFNKDLFCLPHKVTSIYDGICIADSVSDYSGRVVTLDYSGKVKWIYGDDKNSVIIADILSTPLSNIILFETCQRVLHVLDSDGSCIKSENFRDLKIPDPYAMAITRDEKLIIGCGNANENLYVLKVLEI